MPATPDPTRLDGRLSASPGDDDKGGYKPVGEGVPLGDGIIIPYGFTIGIVGKAKVGSPAGLLLPLLIIVAG